MLFSNEASMQHAGTPTADLGDALKVTIEEAKQQVVNMVDEEFIKAFNEWPKQ